MFAPNISRCIHYISTAVKKENLMELSFNLHSNDMINRIKVDVSAAGIACCVTKVPLLWWSWGRSEQCIA